MARGRGGHPPGEVSYPGFVHGTMAALGRMRSRRGGRRPACCIDFALAAVQPQVRRAELADAIVAALLAGIGAALA